MSASGPEPPEKKTRTVGSLELEEAFVECGVMYEGLDNQDHQGLEAFIGAVVPGPDLPDGDGSQLVDAADGESTSWSSTWTTKWAYNEEFRPKWAWHLREGYWRKCHPCRCLHGPRVCLNKAVRYNNFMCRQCRVRTADGEVHCHCTCDGCRALPVHNPEVNWSAEGTA
jgi:hypothetical protein